MFSFFKTKFVPDPPKSSVTPIDSQYNISYANNDFDIVIDWKKIDAYFLRCYADEADGSLHAEIMYYNKEQKIDIIRFNVTREQYRKLCISFNKYIKGNDDLEEPDVKEPDVNEEIKKCLLG